MRSGAIATRMAAALALGALAGLPGRAQTLHIRNYSTEDGLAASQVFAIEQDAQGDLWFATGDGGASRYDGVAFANFTTRDGFQDQSLPMLIREPGGRLWFGSNAGATALDGRSLRNFTSRDGLGAGQVWSGAVDRHGRPWFGTQEGGVSVFLDGKFRTWDMESAGLPGNYVYGLYADSQDRLWIGTRGGGLAMGRIGADGSLTRVTAFGAKDGMTGREIRAIAEDKDGNLWFGTRDAGLFKFDGKSFTHPVIPALGASVDLYALRVTRAGELALGTASAGVARCELPALAKCRVITRRNGLRSNSVLSLFEDREGNLWVGLNSGVSKVMGDRFENFTDADGLADNTVMALLPEPPATLWVGTQGGLNRLELGPEAYRARVTLRFSEAEGLPGNEVRKLLRDRAGRLWVGTHKGLCLFTPPAKCRVFTAKDGLPSDYVLDLLEARNGDFWIGTVDGALRLRGDPARAPERRLFTPREGVAGSQILSLMEDRAGRIWMATNGGITIWDGERLRSLTAKEGLAVETVNKVFEARDGIVWAGTNGGGLARIDPAALARGGNAVTVFTLADGLPANGMMSIVQDARGMLWLGTLAGVAQFDPAAAVPGGRPVRLVFDRRRGLAGNDTPNSSSAAIDAEGNLWFGLTTGLTRYLPARDRADPEPPVAAIERVSEGERTVFAAPFTPGALRTPGAAGAPAARKNGPPAVKAGAGLHFEFRGPWFRDEGAVRFLTRLDGYDKAWSPESAVPFKDYTNLGAGDYTFRVRALSGEGVAGARDAEFRFTVTPPPWQTGWFRALLVLGLAAAVAAYIRLRTAAVARRNAQLERTVAERTQALREHAAELERHSRELAEANARILEADRTKSRFLASMSHELRTPLNSIIGFSEVMTGRLRGRVEPREMKFLGNILESAQQLLGLINNLLDLSKIEAGKMEVHLEPVDVAALVEGARNLMGATADRRRVELRASVEPGLGPVRADGAKVKQILYNLLSNAIKFSPEGSPVEIGARRLGGGSPLGAPALELSVADRGPGIAPELQTAIFEEFRQARGAGESHPGGTGLGLAIVRHFSEIQGGAVRLDSAPGRGSTFRVYLPLEPAA